MEAEKQNVNTGLLEDSLFPWGSGQGLEYACASALTQAHPGHTAPAKATCMRETEGPGAGLT